MSSADVLRGSAADTAGSALPDLATIGDPGFWRALAPDLHIAGAAPPAPPAPFAAPPDRLQALGDSIVREGYARLGPCGPGIDPAGLARTIAAIRARGLEPVFAYAYDEFWAIFAHFAPVLAHVLGPGFRALPDFWAWHVAASDAEAGWKPHRDKGSKSLFPDGRPKSLTLWVALSDATPENGCMYVVPADRDPTYNTPDDGKLRFSLPDIRALPAPAGTAFAWTQAIFHWGARSSSRAAGPRISVGFEFQRGDLEPFNQPLLDVAAPPPFGARLKLIAKQLLQYDHNYPLPEGLRALARGVLGIAV